MNTNYAVEIECEKLFDYLIMEKEDYYLLAYVDYTQNANAYLNYVYLNKEELSNDDGYLYNMKNEIKKYLLPERLNLVIISDYVNDTSYLGAYNVDYGYYLLTNEDEVSILKRK